MEPAQAGGKVQCVCGRQLDVPTMREIVRLEPVEPPTAPAPSRSAWGLWHGLFTLGMAVIVVSAATAIYLYMHRPKPLDMDVLTVGQVWGVWEELRQGVDRPPLPDQQIYHELMTWFYVKLTGLAVIAAMGLACIVIAIVLGRRSQSLSEKRG